MDRKEVKQIVKTTYRTQYCIHRKNFFFIMIESPKFPGIEGYGFAKRNPVDKLNLCTGQRIALGRAISDLTNNIMIETYGGSYNPF